ncbi:MAG: ribosome assembly RNA-binding protein YhbY [Deltaproteobacteria bacterium]|nr:ribosome assembly RNA-binding protein YhbY [Deltaproteobacteria bacterium]
MANKNKDHRHPLRNTRPPQSVKPRKKITKKTEKPETKKHNKFSPLPPPVLTMEQKKELKALAHSLKPLVIVGEEGITEGIINAVSEALEDHELIKVRMREPEDKKEMATELASKSYSVMVALRGHTVILFRPSQKDSLQNQ